MSSAVALHSNVGLMHAAMAIFNAWCDRSPVFLLGAHYHRSDEREPRWDGKTVSIIPEIKTALDAFSAAGFMAIRAELADGGMQLPETIVQAVMAIFT